VKRLRPFVVVHKEIDVIISSVFVGSDAVFAALSTSLPLDCSLSTQMRHNHSCYSLTLSDHIDSLPGSFFFDGPAPSGWSKTGCIAALDDGEGWGGQNFVCVLSEMDMQAVDLLNQIGGGSAPLRSHQVRLTTLVTRLIGYIYKFRRAFVMRQGGLLLHASGVKRQQRGFVFIGRSGAGKSTAARMSMMDETIIFHDDKILIQYDAGCYKITQESTLSSVRWLDYEDEHLGVTDLGMHSLCFAGSEEAPLAAIFILRQASENSVKPVSKLDAANAVVRSVLDGSSGMLDSNNQVEGALNHVLKMLASVPVFELHFCKSPLFWREIDAVMDMME